MAIKRYDADKHSDLVTDNLHLEPGDKFEELKKAVNEALEDVKSVHGIETDLEIVTALTDKSEYDEDADPAYFFMGLSLREGMRGANGKTIFVRGVTELDGWKNRFKDMLVHEIGHQVFYRGEDHPRRDQYYSIRFEGHAENFVSQLSEEKNYGYRPPWRIDEQSQIETEPEKIIEDLEAVRQWPDEAEDLSEQMFVSGGERYPNAEGYTIAYQTVRKLIQDDEISLSDLPGISKEKWKEYCESTIRELYR